MAVTSSKVLPYILKALPSPEQNVLDGWPSLDKERVNHILLVPGSFNPPHLGQLNFVNHAMCYAGSDWNIVGAIIVPEDDEGLAWKYKKEDAGSAMILPQAIRANLWNSHPQRHKNSWAFEWNEQEFRHFRERFLKDVEADGFHIEFICLGGPDNFDPTKHHCPPWGFNQLLISDHGRSAKFWSNEKHNLFQFHGYQPWKPLPIDDYRIPLKCGPNLPHDDASGSDNTQKDGSDSPNAQNQHEYNVAFKEEVKMNSNIWTCTSKVSPKMRMRFVKSNTDAAQISSQNIRNLLENSCGNPLCRWDEVKGLVLSPKVLKRHLKESKAQSDSQNPLNN